MAEVALQVPAVLPLAELPVVTPKEVALETASGADVETQARLQSCMKPASKKAYCGQSCEIKSRFKLLQPLQFDWIKAVFREGPVGVCGLDGCDRPVGKSKLRRPTAYCSEDHRRDAIFPCPNCKSKGLTRVKACCTPECIKALQNTDKTVLLELPRTTDRFSELELKFTSTWAGGPPPKILHIYRIITPRPLYERYTKYRDTTGERREELRWHGTMRNCKVGNNGSTTICNNFRKCFLCSILVRSFDASKSRCGGVFTASTSAYSNGYSRDQRRSPTKAILLGAVSHSAAPNIVITYTPRNETVLPVYLVIYSNT